MSRRRGRVGVVARIALALLLGGCLDGLTPEVGPPLRASCVDEDSDPTVDVDFERDVRVAIFGGATGHCVTCHTPGGATPIGIAVGGLDLSSHTTLLAGGVQAGADIVIPGQPCASALVGKIGAAPPFGARMPIDGPPHLGAAEIQVIADWIAEGARP